MFIFIPKAKLYGREKCSAMILLSEFKLYLTEVVLLIKLKMAVRAVDNYLSQLSLFDFAKDIDPVVLKIEEKDIVFPFDLLITAGSNGTNCGRVETQQLFDQGLLCKSLFQML